MEKKGTVLKGSRFELRFYEGYKKKETPRSVVIGSREFRIDRVLDRKRVLNEQTGKKTELFTCEMEGQKIRLTVHESGKFTITYM